VRGALCVFDFEVLGLDARAIDALTETGRRLALELDTSLERRAEDGAQLGDAMYKASQIIGHPVDIYGSDACLMSMPEISTQMRNAVDYFIGSEEVEPGDERDATPGGCSIVPAL